MERSGRVLHPAVSSVVYLSDGGDPTIVLDETLDAPLGATVPDLTDTLPPLPPHPPHPVTYALALALELMVSAAPSQAAYVAHPSCRSFLTFRGDLLHGVLPGQFAHSGRRAARATGRRAEAASPPACAARLTLLIAWYAEPLVTTARAHLGGLSSTPRPSRSTTWPRALELTDAELAAEAEHTQAGTEVVELRVPRASPVWAKVPPLETGRAVDDVDAAAGSSDMRAGCGVLAALPPPSWPRQHFFLHSATEVGDRLRAEHGIDGSWANQGEARRTRKRRRAAGVPAE